MDLAPPHHEPAPPPVEAAPPPPPPPGPEPPRDRIIGGVAGLLADRLGVDALWLRIGFVLLALVDGLGLLIYAALWLALVVGPRSPAARILGGALFVAGVPLMLHAGGFDFLDGPGAVIALLAGLALALWRPRTAAAPAPAPASGLPAAPLAGQATAPAADEVVPATPSAPPPSRRSRWPSLARSPRPPRPPRQPSLLGRLTLGVAVVVAAGGALIDLANGGRLHPEQWLGAAAVVCGLGLLVGTVRGRARWLVVPAVAFGAAGFVAGQAARIGLEPTALAGTHGIYVGTGDSGSTHRREHVVAGTVDVTVAGAPADIVTIDARVALGEVRVRAARGVTVELRTHQGEGDVRVDGVDRPAGTFTVGPEGQPDVVIDARVGRGRIDVDELSFTILRAPELGAPPIEPSIYVTEGVALSPSGTFVLAGGEAMIDGRDQVVVGNTYQRGGVVSIVTSSGEFRLLPGGQLVTPGGELVDLQRTRAETGVPLTVPTEPTSPGG